MLEKQFLHFPSHLGLGPLDLKFDS